MTVRHPIHTRNTVGHSSRGRIEKGTNGTPNNERNVSDVGVYRPERKICPKTACRRKDNRCKDRTEFDVRQKKRGGLHPKRIQKAKPQN